MLYLGLSVANPCPEYPCIVTDWLLSAVVAWVLVVDLPFLLNSIESVDCFFTVISAELSIWVLVSMLDAADVDASCLAVGVGADQASGLLGSIDFSLPFSFPQSQDQDDGFLLCVDTPCELGVLGYLFLFAI